MAHVDPMPPNHTMVCLRNPMPLLWFTHANARPPRPPNGRARPPKAAKPYYGLPGQAWFDVFKRHILARPLRSLQRRKPPASTANEQGDRGHCTAMISLFSRKRGRGANTRPLRVCWRADYINREVRWAPRQVLVLVNHLIDSILECWMPCHFAHITRSASTPFCTHDHLG